MEINYSLKELTILETGSPWVLVKKVIKVILFCRLQLEQQVGNLNVKISNRYCCKSLIDCVLNHQLKLFHRD